MSELLVQYCISDREATAGTSPRNLPPMKIVDCVPLLRLVGHFGALDEDDD